MPSVNVEGLSSHGRNRAFHRREHVRVLHAKPARGQGEDHRPQRCRGAARADDRAQLRPPGGARPLHAQPLLGQAARPRVRARMHGRRPGAHGIRARQLLQLPPGKPREARRGSGHRADIRPAQPGAAPRADHHGATGGHGRQGHGSRPHVRGVGRHHRPRGACRSHGRVPGHVPHPRRRLRHRERPGRRARRVRPRDRP